MKLVSTELVGTDGRPLEFLLPPGSEKDLTTSSMYGSFQGAQHSTDRGYIFLPTLDSQREVDEWSRLELMRRSRFVYNSGGGLVHRLVNGISRMEVGRGIWPHPLSKDQKWNEKRKQLFMQRNRSRATFDLSQKYSWVSMLQAIQRCKKKDGDCFTVLARKEDTGRLCVMLYEGNQVGSPATFPERTGTWVDGVQIGPHRQPISYEILYYNEVGGIVSTIVDAQNVLHQGKFERPGQVRGLTEFYPVINRLIDRNEIQSAFTRSIKGSARIAYVVEQAMMQQAQLPPGSPGSGLPTRPITMVQTPDGRQVTMEQFFGGSEAWGLKPGQTVKTVQSEAPHPNVSGHLNEELVREACWALGYAPEVAWKVIELGGANSRFAMVDTQGQIESAQDELIEQFAGPWYLGDTRDCIESGDLWEVDDWMLHGWTFPKRMTVDFGRDGKVYIDQYKRGMVTMKTLYGFMGEEALREIDQYLDERQYITQGVFNRKVTVPGWGAAPDVERSMSMIEAFPELQNVSLRIQEMGNDDDADDDDPNKSPTKPGQQPDENDDKNELKPPKKGGKKS